MSRELWTVSRLALSGALEVCSLFERVFGARMPIGLWNWKYADNRGLAIVARDKQGDMVGHYGGLPRQLLFFGEPRLGVQIADVMVAPEVRGVLTRSGPFAMTTGAFLDEFIGFDAPYLIGFGFPSERHLRIAHRLKLYDSVDSVSELAWPAQAAATVTPGGVRAVAIDWAAPITASRLDMLWSAMRVTVEGFIVPVRNADWWRHRFANHPTQSYRCFWLLDSESDDIVGAFVLKPSTDASGACELMDWIGEVQHAHTVVETARQIAAIEAASLVGWFSSTIVSMLAETGCTVTDIGVRVPTSIRQPGPSSAQVNGRWWLTGGDTDFR